MRMFMKNGKFINALYVLALVILFLAEPASAQQGGQIFKDAACNLLTQVLTRFWCDVNGISRSICASKFCCTFRMAWVLVFVSVGIFIFPKFVYVLFLGLKLPNRINYMKITHSSKIRIGQFICLGILICAPMNAYGLESVRFAIKELCQHIEGNLGGLLMVTAGVGGMISAAFGNMKSLYTFVITGIGVFTASSMLSLYFPEAYGICSGQGGGGGGQGNRTVLAIVCIKD